MGRVTVTLVVCFDGNGPNKTLLWAQWFASSGSKHEDVTTKKGTWIASWSIKPAEPCTHCAAVVRASQAFKWNRAILNDLTAHPGLKVRWDTSGGFTTDDDIFANDDDYFLKGFF